MNDALNYLPIKFRLYPTDEQETLFNKTAGCCRLLFNKGLAHLIKCYKKGVKKSIIDLIKCLTWIKKKRKYSFLNEVSNACLQQVLRDLGKAYKNFFVLNKKGKHSGFPRFKSKHRSRKSFRSPQNNGVNVETSMIRIDKIGWINARGNFHLFNDQHIMSTTVYRDSDDRWYASVLLEQSQLVTCHEFKYSACGIDVGICNPITLVNDKEEYEFIGKEFSESLKKKEKRRKRYQRAYDRCAKGSKNQEKARQRVGKAFYREKEFRKDYIEKASLYIAQNHALVAVEDIRLKNMTKSAKGTLASPGKNVKAKSGLNRELLRLGISNLLRRIEDKCHKFGSLFIKVNPKFTSQTCCSCKRKAKESRESQSRFKCIKCNCQMNADVNAAFNIMDLGLI